MKKLNRRPSKKRTVARSKDTFPRKRTRFPKQPHCRVCKRKVDFGNLCYYCRKRRTS